MKKNNRKNIKYPSIKPDSLISSHLSLRSFSQLCLLRFLPNFLAWRSVWHLNKLEHFNYIFHRLTVLMLKTEVEDAAVTHSPFKFSTRSFQLVFFFQHHRRHIARTCRFCCHPHPSPAIIQWIIFNNFKYGKLFLFPARRVVVLWSKLLANTKTEKKTRQKKIMNETFGEHSLTCCCSIMLENCSGETKFARVETQPAWAMENKLFVMTFKCLQFISADGLLLLASEHGNLNRWWVLIINNFAIQIRGWVWADNLCCRQIPNQAWIRFCLRECSWEIRKCLMFW